ncbi:MAG: hypothetical protein OEW33_13075 [Nitrospirota bacterium]|nr:hypothetical protein [Nitrospirota bacterium]
MRAVIKQLSGPRSHQLSMPRSLSWGLRVLGFVGLASFAIVALTGPVWAGVGCDLNVRVNNHTAHSIMVYGASKSSASKSGLNLWSPLTGMVDSTLDSENSGAASHSKQAVELQLPCWTGKVDFKIQYLDGNNLKWTRRDGVEIKSGDTIQININN